MKKEIKSKKEIELLIDNTVVIGRLLREKMDVVQKLNLLIQTKKNLDAIENEFSVDIDSNKDLANARDNVNYLLDKLSEPTFIESISKTVQSILKGVG